MEIDDPTGRTSDTGADRDRTADARDVTADAYDDASEARDARAEARDRLAEAREARGDRSGASADREGAQRDRRGGASDRSHSADDRQASFEDRGHSAEDRTAASIDELTGAHRREAGMLLLDHDVLRARRTGQSFTLAFVDVNGLKAVNDTQGHAAGDALLRATTDAIRVQVRPYDVIVRYGGDEFLCGLLDLEPDMTATRFVRANDSLRSTHGASISVGVAQLEDGEALEALVGRADAALYAG